MYEENESDRIKLVGALMYLAIVSFKNGKWPDQIPRDLPELLDLPFESAAHLVNGICENEDLYFSLPEMLPLYFYFNGASLEGSAMMKKRSFYEGIAEILTGTAENNKG